MSECSETVIALFVGVTIGNILWMTVGDNLYEKWQDRKATKRYEARKERYRLERAERRKKYEEPGKPTT
jgi:hypothetical protein